MADRSVQLRFALVLFVAMGLLALSSCTEHNGPVLGDARHAPWIPIFPDTGSTNAERFGDETYPVFWQKPERVPPAENASISTKLKTAVLGYQAVDQGVASRYQSMVDGGRAVNAVPYQRVNPRYFRQMVDYRTAEKPGTLIVDRANNFLYLVLPGDRALRYGVGLGRQGAAWSGRGVIQFKKKWPRWTPTDGMVAKNNDLRNFSAANGGMTAGTYNPLGARALYIFKNGQDTLYRVHGTPDWQSVGKRTSSGCVRMFNQDVIDLYSRVKDGAEIVVL